MNLKITYTKYVRSIYEYELPQISLQTSSKTKLRSIQIIQIILKLCYKDDNPSLE